MRNTTGIYKPIVSTGSLALLDTVFEMHEGWSFSRKLRSGATNAFRVRRSSDSTEQDIGFSGDVVDETSLATFCSGTDCFVTTMYGQSATARNLTQTTTTAQPKIVTLGTLEKVNGKLVAVFDGVDDFLERADTCGITSTIICCMFAVFKINNLPTGDRNVACMGRSYSSTSGTRTSGAIRLGHAQTGNNWQTRFNNGLADSGIVSTTNQTILGTQKQPSLTHDTAVIWHNGSDTTESYTNGTNTSSNWGTNATLLGRGYTGSSITLYLDVSVHEFIVYNESHTSDFSSIMGNMNSYYSVY